MTAEYLEHQDNISSLTNLGGEGTLVESEGPQVLETISEDGMVSEFLHAEMNSPRFAGRYHDWLLQRGYNPEASIDSLDPDTRKELLWSARPGLLKTLPTDIEWHVARLGAEDWTRIQYINDEQWKNFSSGTRLVERAIEKLDQPNHEVLARRVQEITAQLDAGEALPKIILISTPEMRKLVLLEGHARATAIVSSKMYQRRPLTVIVGTTSHASEWTWY